MRRLPTLARLLLATALILPGVSAQTGFPRDRNEAFALRLVTAFRQSLAREAAWENARRQLREMIAEGVPAGHEIPHAIDMEDVAMLNRVDTEVAAEKA